MEVDSKHNLSLNLIFFNFIQSYSFAFFKSNKSIHKLENSHHINYNHVQFVFQLITKIFKTLELIVNERAMSYDFGVRVVMQLNYFGRIMQLASFNGSILLKTL
ncbi:hypothetical protein ACOSQ3_030934 [Xanthoceras sorbifolium]